MLQQFSGFKCPCARLISYYTRQQYTLRYTGGMVPDVYQILVKEKGVFTNVISPSTKAKLRLSFEVAPIALLIESAGGASSCDGAQASLLRKTSLVPCSLFLVPCDLLMMQCAKLRCA